jgi:hypothetical protein
MSGCGYFADLVKGIIITSIKIHCISDDLGDIEVRIPSAEKFLHQCLINCARLIWKKPYLFYHNIRTIERQYNMNALEEICKKAIDRTLRAYIPLVDVLKSTTLSATTNEESEQSDTGTGEETEEETGESTDTSEESSDESEGEDEHEEEDEDEEDEDEHEESKDEQYEDDDDEADEQEEEDEKDVEDDEEKTDEDDKEPLVENETNVDEIKILYNAEIEAVDEPALTSEHALTSEPALTIEVNSCEDDERGEKSELRNVIIDELLIPAKYRNIDDKNNDRNNDMHRSHHRSSRSRHHSPHKHSKPKVSNAFF